MPTRKKTKHLVIVESPTKAKTISRFLGDDYTVLSSFGHIRDLPKSEMGIDPAAGFLPRYVIPTDKRKVVTALKKAAKQSADVLFATDEDREGEAISWHLATILEAPLTAKNRITFHEITESALREALSHPRTIDMDMVNAQQARRMLDRLVGYTLSPFLWKKVAKGLSAGRVQSVSVRLIVEREREIQQFEAKEYWTIEANVRTPKAETFVVKLVAADGETLDKFAIPNQETADRFVTALKAATLKVGAIEKKKVNKTPPAPYTTSTLQQDANRKLNFSAKQTMMLAQQLYEGVALGKDGEVGLITYMRTDSTNLAVSFTTAAAQFLTETYGEKYRLPKPRTYATKSKGAQEAHEAVRPTDAARTPEKMKGHLSEQQWKLYDLIWRRAVASQMPAAEVEATSIDVDASSNHTLRASGSTIVFDGFLALTPENQKDTLLPSVTTGEPLTADAIEPKQHFTEPPARFSDASLVKALEEFGIGRPSTYAPTIATITERGYVERVENRRLKPTDIAFAVTDLLVAHFPQVVDFQFTANMEGQLDEIAEEKKEWQPVLAAFYTPYSENLAAKEKEIMKKVVEDEATDLVCEKCGKPMVIKTGRFGKFYACTGFPDCRNTKPFAKDGSGPAVPQVTDEKCQLCGKPMEVREGRYGTYLRCTGAPECEGTKQIQKGTGVACPKCGEGEIVEKRSKRGKAFFACNRYPKCDQAFWQKPTGEKCPTCGQLLLFAAKGAIKCSNKECTYTALQPA